MLEFLVFDIIEEYFLQSILGENYNESFKRRMTDRKSRRNHFSQVDGKLVSEGAIGANVCSPFKALYTPVRLYFGCSHTTVSFRYDVNC